jgi:hypothetical protein
MSASLVTSLYTDNATAPSGPAGGVLGGTYPNPSLAVDRAPAASVAGKFTRQSYTGGNITLNGTTWATVAGPTDLTLTGLTAGQVVEVGLDAIWGNEAVTCYLDYVSWVSAAAVNSWADDAAPDNTHTGVLGWLGTSVGATTINLGVGATVARAVAAGDLSSGTLTLRLRARTATAADKTLVAVAADRLLLWARVLG